MTWIYFFFCLRYWAVTQVQYIHSRTFRTVGTMILLIWLTSVVVSLAPLFGWKDEGFYDRVNVEKQCLVSAHKTWGNVKDQENGLEVPLTDLC